MGLFATMDVGSMGLETVRYLIGVCEGMLQQPVAERHWDDYQEFATRLRAELQRHEAAVTYAVTGRG
jgi:hypothetical protein